jgi:DNA-binding CsgD family transcriptional regulator
MLRRAIAAFRDDQMITEEGQRWLWTVGHSAMAPHAALLMWDYDSWDVLSGQLLHLARGAGALSVLSITLNTRAGFLLFAGRMAEAVTLVEEAELIGEATGTGMTPYSALLLAALRGRQASGTELIEAVTKEVVRRGEGESLTFIQWVTALLWNGLGRYEEALAAAQQAADDTRELWCSAWGMVELIEAAVRLGKTELAAKALARLAESTTASGSDWAVGIEARSRALLSDGPTAEILYRQAIEALQRARLPVEVARAELLYGEWLRRERRRMEAREGLRRAHELFIELDMDAFAERARIELEATGEHARKRSVQTTYDLTPQEAQISGLAAEGATNQQIAARLFISTRTVEYHLGKAFRKLGVSSRTQLAHHIHQQGGGQNRGSGGRRGA